MTAGRLYITTFSLNVCVVLSGWISALTGLNKSIPVGIIMILIAGLFTSLAAMSLIMFKKVNTADTQEVASVKG